MADEQPQAFNHLWFDVVKFNMREFYPEAIGVHIWKSGKNCKLLRLPKSEMFVKDVSIWMNLHNIIEPVWANDVVSEETCPHCNNPLRLWIRWYEGRAFCGNCGEKLPGAKLPRK